MKTELLSGIQSLYIDTNIVIYLNELDGRLFDNCLRVFAFTQKQNTSLVTSRLVQFECLMGAMRVGSSRLHLHYDHWFSTIGQQELLTLDHMLEDFERAIENSNRVSLRGFDALHLAAAQRGRCDAILTNDNRFRVDLPSIKSIQLDDLFKED